jgi:predicted O-methyltransferase YrrM
MTSSLWRVGRRAAGRAVNTFCDDLLVVRALGDAQADFQHVWSDTEAIPGFLTRSAAALLYRTIVEVRPSVVVEIGSYLGRSTVLFASVLKSLGDGGRVVAVDPHTGDRQQIERFGIATLPSLDLYRRHLDAAGHGDVVDTLVAPSVDAAESWDGTADFVYVDGWHSYEAVLADAKAWLPHLSERGVVVFDDYLQYSEVRAAVDDAVAMTGLTFYGSAFGQAYTGMRAAPPERLDAVLRIARRGPYRRWHTPQPWRDSGP